VSATGKPQLRKPGAAGHFNQHSVADRLDTELGKDEIGFFKRWQGLLSANLHGFAAKPLTRLACHAAAISYRSA
jgi:hypothetical protein